MTARKRTKKGNVTAAARRKHGSRKGRNRKGSFPVFDHKSAMSALRLRGHAKSRGAVVSKVARWASKHKDRAAARAAARARRADRKR